MEPHTFNIKSSMSTDLPIKNCINSTKKDVQTDIRNICEDFLIFGKISAIKIPKGTKIIILPTIFIIVWRKPEYFM